MENELNPTAPSRFRETLIRVMKADPRHWVTYYQGLAEEIEFKLNFSYLDRSRYYLEREEVKAARQRLMHNLSRGIPPSLISQFMPCQYTRIRAGRLKADPRELLFDRIAQGLRGYMQAGQVTDIPVPDRSC